MAVDTKTIEVLERSSALLNGHFQLSSGRHSDRCIEKFNLLQWPEYTEMVCSKISEWWRAFQPRTVAGPTTGGILLAYEVWRQLGVRGIFDVRRICAANIRRRKRPRLRRCSHARPHRSHGPTQGCRDSTEAPDPTE
jgi:orotate phosphoribosyltransferase